MTLALTGAVLAQTPRVPTTVVAVSATPAPDGAGPIGNFSRPAVNDAGHVAFSAGVGVYRWDGAGLTTIASVGQSAPGGGTFGSFDSGAALNQAGQVGFLGRVTSGAPNIPHTFVGDGTTLLRLSPDSTAPQRVSLNNFGQATFVAGTGDFSHLRRADGATSTVVADIGDSVPGGGTLFGFGGPMINDAGHVGFYATLASTPAADNDNRGIYRTDGTTLVQIVREGQARPGGAGVFNDFMTHVLNNVGQTAFTATIRGGGTTGGIYRGDGSTITEIVRNGQALPDGPGVFGSFGQVAFNNVGQTAFTAAIGVGGDTGIYLGDGTNLHLIARRGQAVPDGSGLFWRLSEPSMALNDTGQVAFLAGLIEPSGGNQAVQYGPGLFVYDPVAGLTEIARVGDPLLGSTIRLLSVAPGPDILGDEQLGLNNGGQVAYIAHLVDGRSAVLLATVPEPAGVWLLAVGALGLLRCRAR
jgi:hypothetical protein